MLRFGSILVTGANRGLGLEFIKQLVNYEPKVDNIIAVCRNPDKAEELNQVASTSDNIHLIKLDVRDYCSYDQALMQIEKIVGNCGLDLLINNAGIALRGNLDTVTSQDMLDNFEVNAVAPLMLSKKLLPLIKTSNRKTIVNISSELGSISGNKSGRMYPYKSSKAALNMVTKNMAVDLEKDGITCIALHPGWVITDMGGKNAALKVDQSVSSMIKTISSLDKTSNGQFLSYDGSSLPW